MKRFLLAALFVLPAHANEPKALIGTWVEPIPSTCGMVLQFKADSIVRKLGDLEYTTKVQYVADSGGWLLRETMQGHNGKKNCLGETAQEAAAHSAKGAYVVVKGGELTYFRTKDERFPLKFRRN
jgi:hypothetical protein